MSNKLKDDKATIVIAESDLDKDSQTILQYMEQHHLQGGINLEKSTELVDYVLTETKKHKYKVGKIIGRGGMGAVLEAVDSNIRRLVAMKIMFDGKKHSKSKSMRFIEEAQITGQLQHPNIIPVYELGLDKNQNIFYTMKYLHGKTLGEIINKIADGDEKIIEQYPLNSLLNIFLKVCDAIAYAHGKNVVHRDLKPDNIMVGEYGEVQVIDWGLAKVITNSDKSETKNSEAPIAIKSIRYDEVDVIQTMHGEVMGTPAFMSPEQALGNTHTHSKCSDIYALGAILYNILTLVPPIQGGSSEQMLKMVRAGNITHPLSLNNINKKGGEVATNITTPFHCPNHKIPESLAAVVMKALSLKVNKRYQSVNELQKEVEAYQQGFATVAEDATVLKLLYLMIKRRKIEAWFLFLSMFVISVLSIGFVFSLKNKTKIAIDALRQAKENRLVAERARMKAENSQKRTAKMYDELQKMAKQVAPEMIRQGMKHLKKNNVLQAYKFAKIASAMDQKLNDVWILKGRLHLVSLNFVEAKKAFDKAIVLSEKGSKQINIAKKYLWLIDSINKLPNSIKNNKTRMHRQIFIWLFSISEDREMINYIYKLTPEDRKQLEKGLQDILNSVNNVSTAISAKVSKVFGKAMGILFRDKDK